MSVQGRKRVTPARWSESFVEGGASSMMGRRSVNGESGEGSSRLRTAGSKSLW